MCNTWGASARTVLTLLVVVGVVAAIPPAAVAASPAAQSPASSLGAAVHPLQAENDTANNTTVFHEDPEEVEPRNRLGRVVSYLTGNLNEQIGTSTLELSQGEYAAAKAAVGEEYADSLDKYVDVQGETGGAGAGDEYRTVGDTQRTYIETVREFRETRAAYEAARRAGNTERSRELARELAELADEGDAQSARLLVAYQTISNTTGGSLVESAERISQVQSEIEAQTEEIVAAEFVETRLSVRSYDRNISFSDPLVLSGTLETANGTPVTATEARFRIGEQTVRTAVESGGTFRLTYRPTTVPANASALTITYRPLSTSVYRRTERTLPVAITQETATVQIDGPAASSYGYADTVAVRATATVNGTRVATYPLTGTLEGVSMSAATTNASGAATLTGTVPATVQPGTATIRIGSEIDGRAVRVARATESVSIASESTELSATARETANGPIVVEGRLVTDEGDPVSGQPVAISIDGRTLGTATMGASGAYRVRVTPPQNVSVENATVTVAFDGRGTNLESATASASIARAEPDAPEANGGGGSLTDSVPSDPFGLALLGAGVVALVLAVVGLRRRDRESTDAAPDEPAGADSVDSGGPDPADSTHPDVTGSALQSATDSLSAGRPNDAVVTAYAGVRQALDARIDVDSAATHWEFYDRCVERGVAEPDSLESLTTGYEKAAYSGLGVSDDDAEALLERAQRVIDAVAAG